MPSRVPVPPPPTGPALEVEAQRRRPILPDAMRRMPVYRRLDFWAAFFAWEHEARRACSYRGDFLPEEEEEDFDNDEEMEEQAPPPPPPPQQQATWPEGVPWAPPPLVDLTNDGSDTSDVDAQADFDWAS